jgi:hypothetical protein
MLQAVRLDVLGLLTDAYNEGLHAVLLMLVPCRLHCSIKGVGVHPIWRWALQVRCRQHPSGTSGTQLYASILQC